MVIRFWNNLGGPTKTDYLKGIHVNRERFIIINIPELIGIK